MKRSLFSALLALAVAIPGLAQPAASHATYRDDPIVRDLKAGKLTVREARLLQEQRTARQQAAVAKTRQQTVQKKAKSKAPIKKLTVAHANTAVKSKNPHYKKTTNKYSNKHGNQHSHTAGKLHRASHPVSRHHAETATAHRAPRH